MCAVAWKGNSWFQWQRVRAEGGLLRMVTRWASKHALPGSFFNVCSIILFFYVCVCVYAPRTVLT